MIIAPTLPPQPVKPTPTQVAIPEVKRLPLAADQYYSEYHDPKDPIRKNFPKKDKIFLHYTAGGSVGGAVASWAADKKRIATPYVIERSGDIYECFDPKLWAFHLGAGIRRLEQSSIGIEIVAYGPITIAKADMPGKHKKGEFITYTNRPLPPSEVVACNFRNFSYYQRFTDAQIQAVRKLLVYLIDRFAIPVQADRSAFWNYQDPKTLGPGIWSHTTVRKDKVDIFPQPEIVGMVQGL